jgi:glycerophosphoryl diester phosphodiesterase
MRSGSVCRVLSDLARLLLSATLPILMAVTVSGCASTGGNPSPGPAHRTQLSERLLARAARAPLVVAHRGSSATWPENTLPAFRAGIEEGADMVELDVHATSDGVLVCLHDATLDRTTDAGAVLGQKGIAVRGVPSVELDRFDAGSYRGPSHAGTKIPTLAAALELIGQHAVPMVEHKDCAPEAMLDVLRATGCADAVLVQSFDWAWLRALRALAPDVTLGALGSGELTSERLAEIDSLGVSMVHWSASSLRLADIEALHARGYLVCTYTVDAELSLLGCQAAGLDAITTNVPARLWMVLRRE